VMRGARPLVCYRALSPCQKLSFSTWLPAAPILQSRRQPYGSGNIHGKTPDGPVWA
jgi:hypothetical protein